MNNRMKLMTAGALMAAVWCGAPLAQSTTTESTTIPGATPQYPPAANSVGVDKGAATTQKSATGSTMSRPATTTTSSTTPSTGMSGSSGTDTSASNSGSMSTTTASNDTAGRTMPARRDRN